MIALPMCFGSLHAQSPLDRQFQQLRDDDRWHLSFRDAGTRRWQSKWFLDGTRAEIRPTPEGMVFTAGPVEGDDACHAVLWTKPSFEGAVKIEYDYTRLDARTKWVNILYIQASGIGTGPFHPDITAWNHLRIIPSMRTYFQNMRALHLSYAAFGGANTEADNDYLRVRRYPVDSTTTFRQTKVPPAYFKTNLFKPGVTYHLTIIKTDQQLFLQVKGSDRTKLFHWDITTHSALPAGRIGLRHMYTRAARYANFKVHTRR